MLSLWQEDELGTHIYAHMYKVLPSKERNRFLLGGSYKHTDFVLNI